MLIKFCLSCAKLFALLVCLVLTFIVAYTCAFIVFYSLMDHLGI